MPFTDLGGLPVVDTGAATIPVGYRTAKISAAGIDIDLSFDADLSEPQAIDGSPLIMRMPQLQPGSRTMWQYEFDAAGRRYTLVLDAEFNGPPGKAVHNVRYSLLVAPDAVA